MLETSLSSPLSANVEGGVFGEGDLSGSLSGGSLPSLFRKSAETFSALGTKRAQVLSLAHGIYLTGGEPIC